MGDKTGIILLGGALLLWSASKAQGMTPTPPQDVTAHESAPLSYDREQALLAAGAEGERMRQKLRASHPADMPDPIPLRHVSDISVRNRSGQQIRGSVQPVYMPGGNGGGALFATPQTFTAISPGFERKLREANLI